jgi:hypothetical protein
MSNDFTNFKKLREAIEKLGITSFPQANVSRWETRLQQGTLEIESADDIVIGDAEDVLFAVNPENGDIHKVILYIPQRMKHFVERHGYPKYHLFHCRTKALNNFFKGENEKYCISTRVDGKFHFKLLGEKEVLEKIDNAELDFCGNCMRIYRQRFNQTTGSFDLTEFFSTNYSSFFREPTFKFDHDDIPNIYAQNWEELSTKYKKTKEYTCEICKWRPSSSSENRYIHAHHNDGRKYNNDKDNIKVLCIRCHAKQDEHSHMYGLPDYQQFMNHTLNKGKAYGR